MVTEEEEDGHVCLGETGDTLGELSLVGLGGVAAFVGVAGEEDEVDVVIEGEVDDLVEGGEEVGEAGAETGVGVSGAVALDAYVDV